MAERVRGTLPPEPEHDQAVAELDPPQADDALTVSPRLAQQMRQAMGLGALDPLPSLDEFLGGHALLGSMEDLEWLIAACCPGEDHAQLTLGRLRHHIKQLETERSSATAKFMEQLRTSKRQEARTPFSLEDAAQCFYQTVYPEVREHLDIAVEQLAQPLHRVILGLLGQHRDDLHGVDMALVPDYLPEPQPRGAGASPAAWQPGQTGYPPRPCAVCQLTFTPLPKKPNQIFCGDACGLLAYATQTWAHNASRTEGMDTLPLPDPYTFGVPAAAVEHAREWQAAQLPALKEQMLRAQERQTGVRRARP